VHQVVDNRLSTPVDLLRVIEGLERELGQTAIRRDLPMQPGDVPAAFTDVDDLQRDAVFAPATPFEECARRFVAWHRGFYG